MRIDVFVILILLIGVLSLVTSGIMEVLGMNLISMTSAIVAMVWFSIAIYKFKGFINSELILSEPDQIEESLV